MVQLEKILCLLFTLLVIYLIDQHCKVEGMSVDAFDNCVDDSDWFTTNKDKEKLYCKDIGTSASCYDFNDKQEEGWERCLKSCGNCVAT